MRFFTILLLTLYFMHSSSAAPLAPPARAEIDALLVKLQASRCEFSRNGPGYSAAEAKSHLLRKLEYLEGRGEVQSAEQFIDLAAATSSLSGQPYRVKCGNAASLESAVWLHGELRRLGAPARAAATSK